MFPRGFIGKLTDALHTLGKRFIVEISSNFFVLVVNLCRLNSRTSVFTWIPRGGNTISSQDQQLSVRAIHAECAMYAGQAAGKLGKICC